MTVVVFLQHQVLIHSYNLQMQNNQFAKFFIQSFMIANRNGIYFLMKKETHVCCMLSFVNSFMHFLQQNCYINYKKTQEKFGMIIENKTNKTKNRSSSIQFNFQSLISSSFVLNISLLPNQNHFGFFSRMSYGNEPCIDYTRHFTRFVFTKLYSIFCENKLSRLPIYCSIQGDFTG